MNADVIVLPLRAPLLERVRTAADELVAGIDRALAANVVAIRRPGLPRRRVSVSSWHEACTLVGISPLADTTRGQWLGICDARTEFTDLRGRKHPVTCTRINNHTRRHAAGSFGRIVAVREDPSEARP